MQDVADEAARERLDIGREHGIAVDGDAQRGGGRLVTSGSCRRPFAGLCFPAHGEPPSAAIESPFIAIDLGEARNAAT
jgi:hypothetical protein